MAIYRSRLSEMLALRHMLFAEQSDLAEINVLEIDHLLTEEAANVKKGRSQWVFQARRDQGSGRKEQLAYKVGQFQNQTTGVNGLIASKKCQLAYIDEDTTTATAPELVGSVADVSTSTSVYETTGQSHSRVNI